MRASGWLRWGLVLSWLAGSGCSSLQEIPRSQYDEREQRRDVRVEMTDGRVFEFDQVHVDGDTLVGYRRQDTDDPSEEFVTVKLALDDVGHLRARAVDWYRTGLLGAGIAAVVVIAGLSISAKNNTDSGSSSGGKPPVP
jgi:hypothetical protein